VAIIGGIITSTLLTLLVVPTFYDSIEITHDRATAKFRARAERGNVLLAFLQTLVEGLLAFLLLRWVYRMVKTMGRRLTGLRQPPVVLEQ
jgi:hypothetical protein